MIVKFGTHHQISYVSNLNPIHKIRITENVSTLSTSLNEVDMVKPLHLMFIEKQFHYIYWYDFKYC